MSERERCALGDPCFLQQYSPSLLVDTWGESSPSLSMGSNWTTGGYGTISEAVLMRGVDRVDVG